MCFYKNLDRHNEFKSCKHGWLCFEKAFKVLWWLELYTPRELRKITGPLTGGGGGGGGKYVKRIDMWNKLCRSEANREKPYIAFVTLHETQF